MLFDRESRGAAHVEPDLQQLEDVKPDVIIIEGLVQHLRRTGSHVMQLCSPMLRGALRGTRRPVVTENLSHRRDNGILANLRVSDLQTAAAASMTANSFHRLGA